MKIRLLYIFIFLTHFVVGQQSNDSTQVDNKYREDQFYIAVTYNLLSNSPSGLAQSGFSSGIHAGVIRDMPINKKRNIAIGLGLGISSNSYNQNLFIQKENGAYVYSIIDDNETSYSKNKFTTYLLEVPLEFRWRTSTPADYKFWRIYAGFKFGYVFANSSKFIGSPTNIKNSGISDFNSIQYGLTFSAGYDTWNVHFYYGLSPIFNGDARLGNDSIDVSSVKIGLCFYIL